MVGFCLLWMCLAYFLNFISIKRMWRKGWIVLISLEVSTIYFKSAFLISLETWKIVMVEWTTMTGFPSVWTGPFFKLLSSCYVEFSTELLDFVNLSSDFTVHIFPLSSFKQWTSFGIYLFCLSNAWITVLLSFLSGPVYIQTRMWLFWKCLTRPVASSFLF